MYSQIFRDLAVGNKFVYSYRTLQGSYDGTFASYYEQVLRDSIINNQRYAVIFSSQANTIRLERSDSNAVYVWWENQDRCGHRYNLMNPTTTATPAVDSVFWTPFGGRTNGSFYLQLPIALVVTNGTTLLNAQSGFNPRVHTFQATWEYQKPFGITRASWHNPFIVNSTKITSILNMRGAVVNGRLTGDTLTPSFSVTVGTVNAFVGQIVRVPLTIRAQTIFEHPVIIRTELAFNSKDLEYLGNFQVNSKGEKIFAISHSWQSKKFMDTTIFLEFRVRAASTSTLEVVPQNIAVSQHLFLDGRSTTQEIRDIVGKSGAVIVQQRAITTLINKERLKNQVSIFPQPILNNQCAFQIQQLLKGQVTLVITNSLGETVLYAEDFVQSDDELYKATLDVSFLPYGVYFLQLRQGKQTFTEKFTKW